MVLHGCLLNWALCSTISDMRGWFTKSERADFVHHCPLPLLTCEPGLLARPVGLISNCSTSPQCDDELNRDWDNLLCMAKNVIGRNHSVQTKFEGKLFLWVQVTHENITQQLDFTTKLSWTNISHAMVAVSFNCQPALEDNV